MRYVLLSFLAFLSFFSFAQINEKGFSFQGYARDFEGTALGNQEVTIRFTIYEMGEAATFVEEQTLPTDPFGLFGTTIGLVNTASFYGIDWGNRDYSLQVEVRAFGADFIEISNSPLLSVPYAQAAGNGVPPGTIMAFGGTIDKVPAGWVPCTGQVLDQTDPLYEPLFDVLGFNWGNVAGQFKLPDLRGRFLRGTDDGSGIDPDASARFALDGGNTGDAVGTYQTDEFFSHNHNGATVNDGAHAHSIRGERSGAASAGGDDIILDLDNNGIVSADFGNSTETDGVHSHNFTTNLTGGAETRPENAAVLYIIKL